MKKLLKICVDKLKYVMAKVYMGEEGVRRFISRTF